MALTYTNRFKAKFAGLVIFCSLLLLLVQILRSTLLPWPVDYFRAESPPTFTGKSNEAQYHGPNSTADNTHGPLGVSGTLNMAGGEEGQGAHVNTLPSGSTLASSTPPTQTGDVSGVPPTEIYRPTPPWAEGAHGANWSSTTSSSTKAAKQPESIQTSIKEDPQMLKLLNDGQPLTTGIAIDGQHITDVRVWEFLLSILDLNSHEMARMACPGEQSPGPRYEILRSGKDIQYFFALDLYQAANVLNRLMASIVQVIRYLGPERCGLSIVEGRSDDGTYNILDELRPYLTHLGVRYWLNRSDNEPLAKGNDRIEELAKLRNMALEPLLSGDSRPFASKAQVIYLNDILVCPDDILELVYQHRLQEAVQTCSMDWAERGKNFYDVYVSRSMTGNTFWEVVPQGPWLFVDNLFYDDPYTKSKFTRGMPFQVFSCWGGMSVIEAWPFMNGSLRFRSAVSGECHGGEPQILASDLARLGIHRVQTVPTVNVGYDSNEVGAAVKERRGFVHGKVNVTKPIQRFEDDMQTERIEWKPPPLRIRCMPQIGDSFWVDSVYDPDGKDIKHTYGP